MSRVALVAISRNGSALAKRLATCRGDDVTLYVERRFHLKGEAGLAFDLPVRPLVEKIFREYQGLVLFMPVGAAVRLLAPCLQDKHADPAVVCVDDAGRFAVSLLSGHLGGADRLALEVASGLEATPVITSGSHVTGTLAVDLLGQEFGWEIEAKPADVTRASAAMVNGEPVGIFHQAGEPDWWPADQPMPRNFTQYTSLEDLQKASCAAALIVSDQQNPTATWAGTTETAVVVFRPRTLIAGMGCRRGVPMAELEKLLVSTFEAHHLALGSLRCIATADLKQEEQGLMQLADKYGVPLVCYSAGELNSVFDQQDSAVGKVASKHQAIPSFETGEKAGLIEGSGESTSGGEYFSGPTPYSRVHELLGIWGVSEPAALLASGSQKLLVPRVKLERATIAVARMEFGADTGQATTRTQGAKGDER